MNILYFFFIAIQRQIIIIHSNKLFFEWTTVDICVFTMLLINNAFVVMHQVGQLTLKMVSLILPIIAQRWATLLQGPFTICVSVSSIFVQFILHFYIYLLLSFTFESWILTYIFFCHFEDWLNFKFHGWFFFMLQKVKKIFCNY